VKRQRRLAGSRGPGDHRQLAMGDAKIEPLEIVLSCSADANHRLLFPLLPRLFRHGANLVANRKFSSGKMGSARN
jgi:hypothetical protein